VLNQGRKTLLGRIQRISAIENDLRAPFGFEKVRRPEWPWRKFFGSLRVIPHLRRNRGLHEPNLGSVYEGGTALNLQKSPRDEIEM
jgi:hypothetical protein